MESRIRHLEQDIGNLTGAVQAVTTKVDKVVDALAIISNQVVANKPMSFQTILGTAISTAVFVGMVVSAIFFLVDARVGSATTRANAFVQEMTDQGRLYVDLARLSDRLVRVETAIKWTPVIVADKR